MVSELGVLLHHHRRLHRWLQPGGHVDGDESLLQAAVRECREETGLTPRPVGDGALLHVDVHPGGSGHWHLDVRYLLAAPPEPPAPPPGESPAVAWFTWSAAGDLADPALAGALGAARRLLDAVPDGDG